MWLPFMNVDPCHDAKRGPFPTPLDSLRPTPATQEALRTASQTSYKDSGIRRLHLRRTLLLSCCPMPTPRRGGVGAGGKTETLDPVRVLPPRPGSEPRPVPPAPALPIQAGTRGTPSSAPPSLPARRTRSPAGRRPSPLDLALGQGYVLPRLLQVHGWEVAGHVFFPATEVKPGQWGGQVSL